MSNPDQAIEMGIRNALCYAVPILQEQAIYTLGQWQRPSVLYRPELSIDGNKWMALYGPDLAVGVAGFGDTPAQAMEAFDKAWAEERPPHPREHGPT